MQSFFAIDLYRIAYEVCMNFKQSRHAFLPKMLVLGKPCWKSRDQRVSRQKLMWGFHWIQVSEHTGEGFTLVLKPQDPTRNSKQGCQERSKKDWCSLNKWYKITSTKKDVSVNVFFGVFPKWSGTFIELSEFSKFGESYKSLKHE